MQLPFTREQFFDLFVAYNETLWPAVVALWTASAVIVALRLSGRHPHDRSVSALLAAHWAWSAVAYHVAFFTRINPAAWIGPQGDVKSNSVRATTRAHAINMAQ
jgi:hypothetical protein